MKVNLVIKFLYMEQVITFVDYFQIYPINRSATYPVPHKPSLTSSGAIIRPL
jgi:hypothetical protein